MALAAFACCAEKRAWDEGDLVFLEKLAEVCHVRCAGARVTGLKKIKGPESLHCYRVRLHVSPKRCTVPITSHCSDPSRMVTTPLKQALSKSLLYLPLRPPALTSRWIDEKRSSSSLPQHKVAEAISRTFELSRLRERVVEVLFVLG